MLITLYKSVLSAAGLVATDEGLVSMDFDGILTPCTVGKKPSKRLVLPIPAILNNPNWNTTIAFHPMSESLLRGESEVLRKLKAMLMVRVLATTSDLAVQLMAIAVNVAAHKKLSPTQHEFLSIVGDVSENTFKDLTKITGSLTIEKGDQLINMYLKRAGQWKGKGYSRVAVTTFPLIQELGTPGKEVFGHNLASLKNKRAIKALFDYILPETADADRYSYGTNSDIAPYFTAMMSSFTKVAKQLNSVTHKFKKHLDDADKLMIDIEYDKELNDLSKYRDLVPSLMGNEGVVLDKAGKEVKMSDKPATILLDTSAGKNAVRNALATIQEAESETVSTVPPAVALPWETPQPQVAAPVAAPPPQPTTQNGLVSFDSLLQRQLGGAQPYQQPFQQPFHQPQYNQQPMLTPQQQFLAQFGNVNPTPAAQPVWNQFTGNTAYQSGV